jgi:hypothetical protein
MSMLVTHRLALATIGFVSVAETAWMQDESEGYKCLRRRWMKVIKYINC